MVFGDFDQCSLWPAAVLRNWQKHAMTKDKFIKRIKRGSRCCFSDLACFREFLWAFSLPMKEMLQSVNVEESLVICTHDDSWNHTVPYRYTIWHTAWNGIPWSLLFSWERSQLHRPLTWWSTVALRRTAEFPSDDRRRVKASVEWLKISKSARVLSTFCR
jgi:hypothetical protein